MLNDHYAAISKDHGYFELRGKLTAHDSSCLLSEMKVFNILDRLRPTAMGLDAIPAWFLRVGTPGFAELLNQSISAGVVIITIIIIIIIMTFIPRILASASNAPKQSHCQTGKSGVVPRQW